MKKLLLSILLVSPLTLLAQNFYFRVGANTANFVLKAESGSDPVNQYVMRPMFGLAYETSINDKLFFRPELLYSEKGLKIRPFSRSYPHSSFRLGYVEAPLFLSFNKKTSKGHRLMLDIGPYFALGISGSYKTVDSDFRTETTTKGKVRYYNEVNEGNVDKIEDDEYVLKRTDFGFKAGVGFQFNGVRINAFYSRGLVNTIPRVTLSGFEQNNNREYNSVFTLSFDFLLNEGQKTKTTNDK